MSQNDLQKVNAAVKCTLEIQESEQSGKKRPKYNDYTPRELPQIGKYTAENGPIRASCHFSKLLGRNVPESTARRLKKEYLQALAAGPSDGSSVVALPKGLCERPLKFGFDLDNCVQQYVNALKTAGSVVNTTIVIAGAKGIVAAKQPSLLFSHGGDRDVLKGWVKSLFKRMHYVKRKGSNAGKITMEHFKEVQEVFIRYNG